MTLRFACSICHRIITDWHATVDAQTGRVTLSGSCHGQIFTTTQIIQASGIAFHDNVLSLPTRDPDEYLRTQESLRLENELRLELSR